MRFVVSLVWLSNELIGNGRIRNENWSWWDEHFGVDGVDDDVVGLIKRWTRFCSESNMETFVGDGGGEQVSCSRRRKNFSFIWTDEDQDLLSNMISE